MYLHFIMATEPWGEIASIWRDRGLETLKTEADVRDSRLHRAGRGQCIRATERERTLMGES